MKNEPTPYQSPGTTPPPRHQFDHATPTVIHDPEQDMTLLARWMHRAMKDPVKFWGVLGGLVVAILAVVLAVNMFGARGGSQSDVWNQLDEAKNADDQLAIAKANPESPAAPWATFQAASRLYQSGVADLPSNSEAALQSLKKAADLYDQLAKSEPKDSPVATAAAFGMARALEARNELPKAVDQYKLVAETWPDTAEAAEAKKLAAELQKPEAVSFYKELYEYKPTKVSLPPLGSESLDFPPVVPSPTDAPIDGSLLIPPPPSSPEAPKAEAAPAEAPKAEAAPAEAPKAEAAPAEAPKPEAVPAEAPKAEAAPAEAPKPEDAPAEAPKAEDAPAEAPKPEDAPAEAPKAEDAPAEAPKA
ncbi:tetratricopeptide repeat protein [Planctomyces sp. SH-PL62]|uniref:tetratricopeptide repeat protein n=1 Tax=Planctomyces sp. SH-PL62 TaxID=1636152 RepID=UPI00078C6A94|nr:hypothetical protein [Planctomyces sp. SH-PL62]AMV38711.1 hypothetical protein VT85_14830 [Planctomyces sp. SH-PL62]